MTPSRLTFLLDLLSAGARATQEVPQVSRLNALSALPTSDISTRCMMPGHTTRPAICSTASSLLGIASGKVVSSQTRRRPPPSTAPSSSEPIGARAMPCACSPSRQSSRSRLSPHTSRDPSQPPVPRLSLPLLVTSSRTSPRSRGAPRCVPAHSFLFPVVARALRESPRPPRDVFVVADGVGVTPAA